MDPGNRRSDVGLTHVALPISDPEASVRFYSRYARLRVVHQRGEPGSGRQVLWLSDVSRPFVIVLIQAEKIEGRLEGFAHLGVGCESREEVDRLCELARAEGCLKLGPLDYGPPVGYWAFIEDPDGHNLEVSHGQEVGFTVQQAREAGDPRDP